MQSKKRRIVLLIILLAAAGLVGSLYWPVVRHAEHSAGGEPAAPSSVKAARQYTCPMHPFIIRDKPGACPICGMTLVPVGEPESAQAGEKIPQAVYLSPSQMLMANVATAAVEQTPLAREVRAVGIVAYDQSRQGKVTAWVAGRIDKLYVNRVGDRVSRSQPVALLYAPELLAAQQEYLLALKSREELKGSRIPSIAASGDGLVGSARQRLKLWGVSDAQLAVLEQGGEPTVQLPIFTPLTGVVIEKLVLAGQYVTEGEALFSIADLSRVWVELALYENELSAVALNQQVAITSEAYPDETFNGRVDYIYPFLDPQTRTLKVRVEIPNPGLLLKPDMYVEARLQRALGSGFSVPVTAVIDTGRRQVVWVEQEEGVFIPQEVRVGARIGDRVQILEGLDDFDRVAVSGAYLLDSEAQLRGPAGGAHAGHGAPAAGAKAPEPAAPAAKGAVSPPTEKAPPAAPAAEHQH